MKPQDRYLMFVQWSEAEQLSVGYFPDLFPAGGVCHGKSQTEAYNKLVEIVDETIATAQSKGLELPEPRARVMREVEMA